jgi:hypothetical protein
MSSKPWTPTDDALLRKLRAARVTIPQIADVMNRRHRDIELRCVHLDAPSTVTAKDFAKPGPRPIRSDWPDYWTRNAAEGSARLRDALLSFFRKRAA